MGKDILETGCERGKIFWSKIWEQKDHNKKAEWINMEKQLHIHEEGPKVQIHFDTLKKYQPEKTLT